MKVAGLPVIRAAAAALLMLATLGTGPSPAEDETVTAVSVPTFLGAVPGDRVQGLVWRGGLQLHGSSDAFGGLSGLGFTGGGLLQKIPVHPTMWVRGWFESGGSLHQRGYTLVDPDPESDTFDIEFLCRPCHYDPPARTSAKSYRTGTSS